METTPVKRVHPSLPVLEKFQQTYESLKASPSILQGFLTVLGKENSQDQIKRNLIALGYPELDNIYRIPSDTDYPLFLATAVPDVTDTKDTCEFIDKFYTLAYGFTSVGFNSVDYIQISSGSDYLSPEECVDVAKICVAFKINPFTMGILLNKIRISSRYSLISPLDHLRRFIASNDLSSPDSVRRLCNYVETIKLE